MTAGIMDERGLVEWLDHELIELNIKSAVAYGSDVEEDAQLADALEVAFKSNKLDKLLQQERERAKVLEETIEKLTSEGPEKWTAGEKKTTDAKSKLGSVSREAQELLERVESETEKVSPLTKKIEPLLRELDALNRAKSYATCALAIEQSFEDVGDEEALQRVDNIGNLLKSYHQFLSATNEPGFHIGTVLAKRFSECTSSLRRKLESKVQQNLDALDWPISANNPSLNLTPNNVEGLSRALADITRLQLRFIGMSKQSLNGTFFTGNEFTGDLWSVRALAKPIVQRFKYHFSGKRATNRIDQPDWYHQFVLQAVKDHSDFLVDTVQPIIESQIANFQSGGFVDVLAHFIRVLIQMLHAQYSVKWDSLTQLNSLICNTVDESLALDTAMIDQFGYCAESDATSTSGFHKGRAVWPKALDFWCSEKGRFVKWMEADLEFARKRVEQELSKPTAWRTIFETVGVSDDDTLRKTAEAMSSPVTSALVSWTRPECCDHFVSILSAVADRAFAIRSLEFQLVFVRLVQLPLIEDYCATLETQLRILHVTPNSIQTAPLTAISQFLILINGAEYPRIVLSKWQEEPRYVRLSQFVLEHFEAQNEETLDANAALKVLQGAERVTSSLSKALLNISSSVRKRVGGKQVSRSQSENGGQVEQSSRTVLGHNMERLSLFVDSNLAKICEAFGATFKTLCSDFVSSAKRGAFCTDEIEPFETPAFLAPTEMLRGHLELIETKLHPRLAQTAAEKLAQIVSQFLVEAIFDGCRFNLIGGQRLQRDFERLCTCFSMFSKKPANRFFRALKERVNLLASPIHHLASFSKALRRLMQSWDGYKESTVGQQLVGMLEDGYAIATLSPQDVLLLISTREDVAS